MIAQHVMTSTCIEAGLESSRFLCDASGVPPASGPLVSVATVDVLLFERGAGGSFAPGSTAPLCEELDKVWKHHDIKGKSAKKNRLSGYVPFVQIHEAAHKAEIARPIPSYTR